MNSNIEELKASILNLKTTRDRNVQDGQSVTGIDAQISDLEAQIAAAEQEVREKEIQEKVEGDEITFNVQGVDFTKLPAEMIQLIDVVVRADRKRIYLEEAAKTDELTAKHKDELAAASDQVSSYKAQVEVLQKNNTSLQSQVDDLSRENERVGSIITKQETTIQDLDKKLTNSAAQIDENQKEIERLNSQIDDYQKAQVYGERTAQKIIDVTPDETNAMQNLVNSISKKYIDIQPIGGNWHEAVAEDGSKTVVHTKDLPSLETQGSPFRDETNPALLISNQLPSTETVENVGASFPQVQPPAIPTVQSESTDGTVVPKTMEQRVAELERAVFGKGQVA